MTATYESFLARKTRAFGAHGFDVAIESIDARLFPFQRAITRWALKKGRAACFADCGLGKSYIQCEWARQISTLTNGGRVLILAPFGGIGSEGYVAVSHGRRYLGIELKRSYYDQACANLGRASSTFKQQFLFPKAVAE